MSRKLAAWIACAWACSGGCAALRSSDTLPPHAVLRGPLVIHSEIELADREDLVQDLLRLRHDVAAATGLPASHEPIFITIFANEAQFDRFAARRYPQMAGRRAYFVKSGAGLSVYAQWGERVQEDLRHELTHGYLHAVVTLPLWLDEGLAEYFELPDAGDSPDRWHAAHLQLLRERYEAGTWTPDLRRLEQLQNPAAMQQIDYAEAWLWVHYLLHVPARQELFKSHLDGIRRQVDQEPLAVQLRGEEASLLTHLLR